MENKPEKKCPPMVLVPVDFSEICLQISKIAIRYAAQHKATVVLLHVFNSPYYVGGLPITDAFAFDEHTQESYNLLVAKNQDSMLCFMQEIRKTIATGEIPDIQLVSKFREGVTEEQILIYARKHKPMMIFLGAKNIPGLNGFGSTITEIIDRANAPVLVCPFSIPFDHLQNVQSIGFVTSFEEYDLVAFDKTLEILNKKNLKVYFLHFYKHKNEWDKVQLSGIEAYLKKQYASIETSVFQSSIESAQRNTEILVTDNQIDLLVFASQKKNLFLRVFNPGLTHKLVEHTKTPFLVLHV